MPRRPILTLQNTGNATIQATVDRTSPVQSVLLINVGLPNNTILLNPFKDYIKAGMEDEYKKWADANAVNDAGATDYTILKAMKDNYQPGVSNNRYPSVFDWFASDTLKDQIMSMIDVSGTGTLVKAYSPAQTIQVSGNATTNKATLQYKESALEQGVSYVCLAMAGSGTVESRGFRSDYPITIVDDSAPEIQSVTPGLYPTNDGKTVSGSITIQLTRPLYRYGVKDPSKLFPVKGSASLDPESDGSIGFGSFISVSDPTCMKINPSDAAPIDFLTITVTDAPSTSLSITFNGRTFYGESGTPMKGVTVQVNITDRENGKYDVVIQ